MSQNEQPRKKRKASGGSKGKCTTPSGRQVESSTGSSAQCEHNEIQALQKFKDLHASWPEDTHAIFSEGMPQERRQELWELVCSQASLVCDEFAWAIPDERAIRILAFFGPIIEIGAGAGYWAHCLQSRGVQCVAYDAFPAVTMDGKTRKMWCDVHTGGPEKLLDDEHAQKALLLCYPDDYEHNNRESLAAQCLHSLRSDTVIHAGELFGDTASLDHAPWGRTTGAEAQQHLFSIFRCVIKVPLPSWPHCNDYLTVWKRIKTCNVAFSSSDDSADVSLSPVNDQEGDSREVSTNPSDLLGDGRRHKAAAQRAKKSSTSGRDKAGQHGVKEEVQCQEGGNSNCEEEEDEGDDDCMEFVCDFRKFSLGAVQVKDGWALDEYRHLL